MNSAEICLSLTIEHSVELPQDKLSLHPKDPYRLFWQRKLDPSAFQN